MKPAPIVSDSMRFALWASKLRQPPTVDQAAEHFGYEPATAHRRVQAYRDVAGLPPLSALVPKAKTFHGRVCWHCGGTERYRSSRKCTACQRQHRGGRGAAR